MSGSAAAGLCRLRFHGPHKVVELSVPADVPLADLLPTIVGYCGDDLDERAVEAGGWVLQRLGEEPLDEERAAEALGLRDGERLYLRMRREALPEVHFDDIVDGVASGLERRGGGWHPALTHHMALGVALLALAGGFALLALSGGLGSLRVVAAAGIGGLLLLGAGSAARAVGDAGAGTALGTAAVPYLALSGALLPAGGSDLTAARLLAGGSAAAGASVLALASVACSTPLFLGLLVTSVTASAAGALVLAGLSASETAGALAVLVVAFGAFLPGFAFRLSGLKLPALPRRAAELQEDIEPYPAQDVVDRSAVADGYLTAFHGVTGAVCAACLTLLAPAPGWAAAALAAVLSLLLILHVREVGSRWQRLALILPGVYGLTLLATGWALSFGPTGRLGLLTGLVAAAAALAIISWTLPGRRLLPYWGRAADLLHSALALSLIPLALTEAGVFAWARALNG
ncbi:type VII secretion integral membrane protein EccD [Streptomyces luteolifulvus]|uniref:Type VII secretion integral membrane protein EccD n=1 Tax=Streptomyces luteolifulvus TaxID=2615112 RepID=A0A6H9URM6_9ACTN|nr:type VII secretion integral membrane protein EccD [Streptomyces luteolifulvus]KAB1140905.1 type VII secretion integral membrane protein EccD [Streptomyces luteolifulvus]